MKYPFKDKDQSIENYLYSLKEYCIVEHEDNWFKEKSHTKLYPNIDFYSGITLKAMGFPTTMFTVLFALA